MPCLAERIGCCESTKATADDEDVEGERGFATIVERRLCAVSEVVNERQTGETDAVYDGGDALRVCVVV